MTRKPRPKLTQPAARKKVAAKSLKGPAVRLLPAIILAGVAMLGFRLQVVVNDVTDMVAGVTVETSVAVAQEVSNEPAMAEDMADDMAMDDAEMADEEMADEGSTLPENLGDLTAAEINTLQRLAERRKQIEDRGRELERKEALLMASEARIDRKIGELQGLETQIENLLKRHDEQEQAKIDQLVRIYGAMKPKDAARIFNSLEMPILLNVVENMKENKVAPIIAQMDAVKATALTEELSTRRRIPLPDQG